MSLKKKINSYFSTDFIQTSILRQLTDERIMPKNAMAHKENCSICNQRTHWAVGQ
jgi:hypothetical protein